jgi:6-phosphofructokinase
MMREKLYVEGIQEIPEIRAVTLGHLVRCGRSSVYDVNFGKEVGASAVVLLTSGLSDVTVTGLRHGKIEYIPTAEAIKQRHVDLNTVALYEKLGLCFGRVAADTTLSFAQKQEAIERFL